MSLKSTIGALIAATTLLTATASHATLVSVDAMANSIAGGVAANSGVFLNANQSFSVDVDPSMLWNFGSGDPSYTTNANGMPGWTMYINNPDGSQFGALTGALFGQIGNGNFFNIGTHFSGAAGNEGTLNLFYMDSDAWNNIGAVTADIQAVPEPATLGLMGLGLVALLRRRRAA
jgi:hypothetical protein